MKKYLSIFLLLYCYSISAQTGKVGINTTTPQAMLVIKQKVKEMSIPKGVEIEKTPFDEQQKMLREIDAQRKKDDPEQNGHQDANE